MIPIPAIDLKDGKCVRLLKGDINCETVYGVDPVAMAKRWESGGARRLHIVDLDGAVKGHPVHSRIIQQLAKTLSIPIEVGGGIRRMEDIETYIGAGVHTVIVGTSVFLQPGFLEQVAERFPNQFAIALDTRGRDIAVKGWLASVPDKVDTWLERFNRFPVFAIIHTDITRDGTRQGPNTIALRTVLKKSTRPVIASGGIGSLDDLMQLKRIEKELNKSFLGVIIGRALYEQNFTLSDAASMLEVPTC